eukprot:CAMPEP_0201697938 /NCGR_PEP_ID=MMETSP0578-20130828/15592_1 /ASSEMBLY_ACC=CAM_ASM_000663 /TAXON_ID=267565 /ORGANISM="Skeletonema grethea, Strain CCMP 1804" /LENGTH=680 /DNA_ID=CAMNT_0048184305 /DNA_START=106 /DNA_END=2148 /DNA_ORIENTATION=-
MSFSHNRGTFSLSNSNESPRQKSPDLSSKFVNNNSVNSLGFLLQAASNNNNNAMGPGDQQQGAQKPSDMDHQQAMELQQALQMSMATQNQQSAHPSALFATNRPANSSAPTAAAQATAQIVTQLQAQQLLAGAGGQVNQQVFAPQASMGAAAASQAPSAPGNNNANVINQLVASLQAQQQAQQQVQVQAAIARAFGPGGGGGLSAAGFNNNPMVNLAGMASSISQPSARDILSRMQLVQAVQQDNSNNAAAAAGNGNANDDLVNLQQAQQSASLNDQLNGFKTVGLLNPQVAAFSNNVIPGLNNTVGASSQGAVIVPCRARGMPVDHNFKTAYFIIPDGIEHGDELVCSYPSCRQAGVKFRYCLHCKVPVAKRNFRNRHRHGVPGGDGGSVTGEDDESVSSEGTVEENDGKAAANPAESLKDDDDYSGVKKEHLLIIPGVDTTSEEKKKKKKKKSKRVPCRARGMPMAHNFKTSYFIIPDNIQHGDELECSFPACRSAGAKFRYCLHCKVPVAKRNFRNRHKHGNMGEKKRSPPSATKESENAPAFPSGEGICLPVNDAKNDSEEKAATLEVEAEGDLKPSSVPQQDPVVDAPKNEEESEQSVSVSTGENAKKVQSWVSLLESKPDPDDKEAMTKWMMKVMNASGGGAAAAAAPAATASVQVSDSNEPPKKKLKEGSEDC